MRTSRWEDSRSVSFLCLAERDDLICDQSSSTSYGMEDLPAFANFPMC